ncbi:alpha amylase N-terminal ig-like domain-containing protein [Thermoanaerobacter sp. A7A]|uniref:alpha amylase N-terminal ig-like domain-containing protein n=1 Tax=Thermoanaerobacter sp. A7A TaxID=1350366 RepID=UPI00040E75E9|nr:alpha amylase N-terminal ig-like domain-containing protein [Thermoanaerobacter sp. A7A]
MFKRRALGFLLSFLLIFTAVFGSMPMEFVKADTDAAPATAVVAGNFQSKLGDTDWKGDSSITVMTYKGNGFYEYTTHTALPAGDYEYKIVLNGSQWIPDGFGNNLKFHLDKDSVVTFYYNYNTSSVTDSTKYTPIPEEKFPRIVGTIQSAIGAGDDWKPETSTAIMRDYKFNNVYEYTANVPKGNYEFKVTLGSSWDINYGLNGEQNGPNIPLNVAYDTKITFYYDSISHNIWTDYNPTLTGPDNNIYYDDLKHDTHDPFFRSPFGAIKTGDTVTLRIQARNHDLESAKISYWDDIKKIRIEVAMYKIGQSPDGKYEYWEVKLSFDHPTRVWYYFILKDGTKTAYYGDNDEQLGGVGKATDTVNKDFELTVYDKNLDTPDWMKGAVMYQIFPDRFFNGDPSNDHLKKYSRGFDPAEYHSNWDDLPDNPNDKDKPGYTGDGIWSNDFFGGDLKGIDDKLDYLKSLGISVIYINPIFQSPSNHRYDTTDYTKIDELLGDLSTFKKLMEDAHAKGIKVILDGVFNHTSDDSIYFDRYGKYLNTGVLGAYQAWKQGDQSKSPYGDWYEIKPDGTYEGWWGFDSLPVIRQINGSEYNVKSWADFIINNPNAISKYWLNPDGDKNAGADGWRLDVANEVAHDFWVHFRDAINNEKPNAPMIAELWGDASLDLLGDSFNSVMNYLFRNAAIDFILDKSFDDGNVVHNPIDAAKLDQRLMSIYERYPLPVFYSTMNLLGSHDTMRILTVFGYNSADANQNSQEAKDLAVKRLKLAAILQMGYPGMPSIYYGDEAGQSGGKDPDNRRTFPWGREDTDLQAFFKKVVNIRNDNQVLKTGDLETLYANGDVYAFGRRIINGKDVFGKFYPDSVAIVVINKGDAKQVSIDTTKFIRDGVAFTDALSGKTYTVQGGKIVVEVGSMDGAILISDTGQNLTAPQPITDLKAVSGNGKVDLSWSVVDKAVSYNIYRSTVKGGLYEKIASNVTQTTYTDTEVTNGLKYVYAVTAVDRDGNESALSNEVEAYPAFPIGWAGNMNQVGTHVISVNNPVEVYAEVWADGLTNKPGQGENMIAQLGYRYIEDTVGDAVYNAVYNKVEGVEVNKDWTWVDAQYVGDSGNNDKYMAKFVPDMVGTWEYIMRFSSNQGHDWTYTKGRDGKTDEAKQFIVVPSNDVETPTAPVLQQPGIESSRVTLNWSPSADDVAIFGYEIYKSSSETGPFIKIATVSDSVYNYVDTDVVNGNVYYYKVVAVDTSYNRTASNTVKATPDIIPIKVTFNVTVPDYTPDDGVNIAGNFPDAFWNPTAQQMTKTGPSTYSITLTLNEGTQIEYKYARGSWDKVEKGEYGNEIDNRKITVVNQGSNTMVVNDTVQRWRDLPVYIYSPKDKTTVDANTSEIEIKGNTYKGAKVTINDESFVQQENGVFTKVIPLEYGVNTIKIHVEPSGDKNNELTKDITITVTREEPGQETEPAPTPPTETTKPAQEVSQGKVVIENNTTTLTIDENKVAKDIKDTSKKEIQFDLTNIGTTPQKALEIPVTVLNLIAENNKNVVVKSDEVTLQFDAKTLGVSQETIDLISKAGTIKLNIHNKGKITASSFEPVTSAYDITIKAGDKDIKIGSPVKMTFNIKGGKDIRKIGVYYLNEKTNQWEYVGGRIDKKTNTITFEAKHFSTYGVFEYNKEFKDVTKDNWAYDVVNVLTSRHIIKGIDSETFLPNAKISRAEFAALMIRALGIEEEPYKGEFNDVKEGAWYANAIEAAYKEGIILGDGKNMRPDDPITREEMTAVIMRVYGKLVEHKEDSIGNTTFSDNNKISEWARDVIANAVKLGIVRGYEDNTFKPKDNATRAEAAAMLYRILEKTGNI